MDKFDCIFTKSVRYLNISGKFSSSQRAIYNAVLAVQEKCICLCTVGFTLDEIYIEMLRTIGHQLQDLGILERNLKPTELFTVSHLFSL